MANKNQQVRQLPLQQKLVQLVNQIDEIDRFYNECISNAANGKYITVADIQRLTADAAARPLLQQEKERVRAERNQLGDVVDNHDADDVN